MIVYEFVLSARQLEQLRKDGINEHVLGFVLNFVTNRLTELVKWSATLGEDVDRPIAIDIDQEFGDHLAIEIELVDGINDSISHEGGGDVGSLGYGVDLLVRE